MSLAIRPTLRPVVWADVDSRGKLIRHRSPSADSRDDEDDYAPPEPRGYPPRKKVKTFGTSAGYYPPLLNPSEKIWRERCTFLFQRGYQLRPRYQPQWSPTGLGNGRHHHSGEDHIMQILPQVLDAIRRQDGLVVCIKMIQDPRRARQIKITEYFSTRRMTGDSRNHVVPFYDTFGDNFSPDIKFMVMPVLRRFDDPEFLMVCEVVDFITQALEGMAFLHENNVAHHNLIAEHIMMDAKSIIPTGWHFVSHFCEPDGMTKIVPLERKNSSVRYYFVGFGNAYHMPPEHKSLVRDIGGGDDDVPELSSNKPYDPFKLDVYTLGNVFLKELYLKYLGLDFIPDLLKYMHIHDFSQRPNADTVLRTWYRMRDTFDEDGMEVWRLRYRDGRRPGSGRHSEESHGSPSGVSTSRSNKRDISSILNM